MHLGAGVERGEEAFQALFAHCRVARRERLRPMHGIDHAFDDDAGLLARIDDVRQVEVGRAVDLDAIVTGALNDLEFLQDGIAALDHPPLQREFDAPRRDGRLRLCECAGRRRESARRRCGHAQTCPQKSASINTHPFLHAPHSPSRFSDESGHENFVMPGRGISHAGGVASSEYRSGASTSDEFIA